MVIDYEILEDLSLTYGISLDKIIDVYGELRFMPFVTRKDTESLINCIEYVLQDMASDDFIKNGKNGSGTNRPKRKPYDFSLCDALLEVYGEEASSYLSSEYKKYKGIETQEYVM